MNVEWLHSEAELQFSRGRFVQSQDPETDDAGLEGLGRRRGSPDSKFCTTISVTGVVPCERCIWEIFELCETVTIKLELRETILVLLSIIVDIHFQNRTGDIQSTPFNLAERIIAWDAAMDVVYSGMDLYREVMSNRFSDKGDASIDGRP